MIRTPLERNPLPKLAVNFMSRPLIRNGLFGVGQKEAEIVSLRGHSLS